MNDDNEFSEDELLGRQIRQENMRIMRQREGGDMIGDDDQDMDNVLDLEEAKGKLSIWVSKPDVIKFIRKIFSTFLRAYKDENGNHVYE
jgi:hypothetical protein